MNRIIIEAKHARTAEYHFLRTILDKYFADKEVEFIFMDGITHLFDEAILNQILQAQTTGDCMLVLVDADTIDKGYGYEERARNIEYNMKLNGLTFPYFIYPNNNDDGDVECLIESVARRDLHSIFFDCFEDYEKCVSGVKDASGNTAYNTPNRKGKLHTYISAQKINKKSRDRLGSGDWLFDNSNFWNLDKEELQPLKEFFDKHLK